jgi:uncharacterized protein (TIGR02466 family)
VAAALVHAVVVVLRTPGRRSRVAAWASSPAKASRLLLAKRSRRASCTSRALQQPARAVAIRSYFATRIYTAALPKARAAALNTRLLRECHQLAQDDRAGQRWSKRNYPGGFTSYASASRMHGVSPTFAALQRLIDAHVRRFATELEFDLGGKSLAMSDCWVNLMPRGVAHGLHLHPLSVISGTYYVRVPRGAAGLKFEDPRLSCFMGAPPRQADAAERNRAWIVQPARAGSLVLFESWLRHEVAANPVAGERVSISFNYGWN